MNRIHFSNKTISFWLPLLIFCIGSFIYFAFFGDYVLFYQEKSALFIFSSDFLKENLHQPGEFLIWLGKFFTTFYFYSTAGSIILSCLLTLIVLYVIKIIRLLTGDKALVIPFVIGAALFYLQTNYRFYLFNNLGLLFQLVLFSLTIKYKTFIKGWLAVLMAPLCFYVTGGFTWIYLLLVTYYFVPGKENKRWIKIFMLWGLSVITFYISKEFLFFQSAKTLMTFPFTDYTTGSQQILFITVAGIISFLPIISATGHWLTTKFAISEIYYGLFTTIILTIFLVTAGIIQFDSKTKQYFYVEKLFYEEKFNEVIAYNTSNPPTNLLTIFLNNISLCETDKLDDQLFHFQQSPDGKTLFLKWEMVSEILNSGGYFYYTIGMINEAHRWAFENMVMKGQSPEGLKMLIKTELIYGNYEVASKYINILKQTFFYRKEAKKFEKLLFSDIALNADRELGIKRQTRVKNDFFTISDNPYINLEMILSTDSMNKKAFEYKIAFLLLKKNFKAIAKELPKFEKFGFTRLPINVEEAAIALSISNNGRLPEMGNLQISKTTEQKWNQYLSVLQQYNNNVKSAEPALKRRFGDTFWYYVFYK